MQDTTVQTDDNIGGIPETQWEAIHGEPWDKHQHEAVWGGLLVLGLVIAAWLWRRWRGK